MRRIGIQARIMAALFSAWLRVYVMLYVQSAESFRSSWRCHVKARRAAPIAVAPNIKAEEKITVNRALMLALLTLYINILGIGRIKISVKMLTETSQMFRTAPGR